MVAIVGDSLIDFLRIVAYGQSFKHCWRKGATISLRGEKLFFANEARSAIGIYTSKVGNAFPELDIVCDMIPEQCNSVELERFGDKVVVTYGERGYKKRNTFRAGKDIATKVMEAFVRDYTPENSFAIETSMFDILSKDIDVTTLKIEEGNFSMSQQSPDADFKTENIWDFSSMAKGTMLQFMRRKIPNITTEVMVGTDELQGLKLLGSVVNLSIQGKTKPLCGSIEMFAGDFIFMLYPFIYKVDKDVQK